MSYPLPGEVAAACGEASGPCVLVSHAGGSPGTTTLSWPPEPMALTYNVYRDALSSVGSGGFGNCLQQGIAATSVADSDPLPAGGGFFYLVTAESGLAEEGIKGLLSSGAARRGTVCP
jgi:hypothetical protein